jgi:hypothetical protein
MNMEMPPQSNRENQENEKSAVEKLNVFAFELGFVDSGALQAIRAEILNSSSEKKWENIILWTEASHAFLENLPQGIDMMKAEIGVMVARLAIYKENGMEEKYAEELNDAKDYAFNLYMDDIVEKLDAGF